LLLDEPTSGLDAETTERVECIFFDFMKHGGAILMVTHNAEQAKRFGPRRIVVEQGHACELIV
jgi:ABC-type phosphate transport system ATPase subunit